MRQRTNGLLHIHIFSGGNEIALLVHWDTYLAAGLPETACKQAVQGERRGVMEPPDAPVPEAVSRGLAKLAAHPLAVG